MSFNVVFPKSHFNPFQRPFPVPVSHADASTISAKSVKRSRVTKGCGPMSLINLTAIHQPPTFEMPAQPSTTAAAVSFVPEPAGGVMALSAEPLLAKPEQTNDTTVHVTLLPISSEPRDMKPSLKIFLADITTIEPAKASAVDSLMLEIRQSKVFPTADAR
jgi:hypothetical protein